MTRLPGLQPRRGAEPGEVTPMKVVRPYPTELLRVARKVVWSDEAEQTLDDDIQTFLDPSS